MPKEKSGNKKKKILYQGKFDFDSSGKPKPTKSEFLIVKSSKIHQHGIFAAKDIPKGKKIIEYVGEKITKKESEKRADEYLEASMNHEADGGVYIFELNKRYDIDGKVSFNTARLINHSCDPNCESYDEEGRIWIASLRTIKKGEEITYNYGYDMDSYKEHPCKCGSKNCVGFIVHEKFHKKIKKIYEK